MKTKLGILSFVFLTGLFIVATPPAHLYAGTTTTGGTAWDPFINVSFFSGNQISKSAGTKLAGVLSIYYNDVDTGLNCEGPGGFEVEMYVTVRLSQSAKSNDTFTYDTVIPYVCSADTGSPGSGGQGDLILNFLKSVVLNIYPNANDAYLTSVEKPGIAGTPYSPAQAFVANINIAVQQ
jgi:hypothetical protein